MNAKKFRITAVLIVIFVLIFSSCTTEEETSSPLSAGLSELQGLVEMKQAGEQDFSLAEPDSTLEENGQIQTGDDGKARLDLSTGTIVRVSPSSLFTLISNAEVEGGLDTNLKLELGRIFIILSGGSMEVDTPSGVASVRGSHMMVEVDPVTNNVLVTCLTGKCVASNQAGEVHFTEGEKTILFTFDPDTGQFLPPTVEPMSAEDYQLWLDEHPEAAEIINQAIAAMKAQAASATEPPPTEPPATEPPATEPPATEAPSGGSSSDVTCFNLLEPASGSGFYMQGGVNFSWEAQDGAAKYVLEFVYPNGTVVQFETTETNITRYIESMPAGGSYSWNVTAYDENGGAICSPQSNTFTKAETKKRRSEPSGPACDPCDDGGACYDSILCFGAY